MSGKKYFTLINGSAVHQAGKGKIIPAESFSELLESHQLIEKVQKDGEDYRLSVAKECEKLKEKAQKEGYEEGFKAWVEHIAKLEEEIIQVRKDLEKMLGPVALKAAKKIVGREIELNDDTIVDIVSNSLKAVSQHKKIAIYVNKKDLEILERNRAKLKQLFENLEVLSLRDRADIAPGGCVIETEGGIINAQLENQWRTLESALDALFKKKPGTTEKGSL